MSLNPRCPEPKCIRLLRIRKLITKLGLSECPNCRRSQSKPFILTEKKKGMRKCLKCRKDFMPKRREGLTKYFICQDHPWQKFKVGAEVISYKTKPKTAEELIRDAGAKKPFQAKKKPRQPNVQMRPRA